MFPEKFVYFLASQKDQESENYTKKDVRYASRVTKISSSTSTGYLRAWEHLLLPGHSGFIFGYEKIVIDIDDNKNFMKK